MYRSDTMSAKDEQKILKEVADQCSTGQPINLEKADFHPDQLQDFILAASTYGGWKKPLEIRDYQMRPAWDIVDSVINRRGNEIVIMFARQSGKTTSISGATNFFLSAVPSFHEPFSGGMKIGIFGPKKEQADYAFDMYKMFLNTNFLHDYLGIKEILNNTREVRLSNGSRIFCESASKNASIERFTLDFADIEEAQNVEDTRILNSIYPMCASTNGTRALIGTPTIDRSGYFYQMSTRRGPHNHRADWRECAKYSKYYESYVKKEMKRHGANSDYFKSQYELEWPTMTINFCTLEELTTMRYGKGFNSLNEPCVAGLDTARITDETVLSIIKSPTRNEKPHLGFWAAWQGDDTRVQASEIAHILTMFPALVVINVDTQHGIGHGIADLLPETVPVARYPMDPHTQSRMWKTLREAIVNQQFTYADVQESERYIFEEQMTTLKTKWIGDRLKVEATGSRHDDFADSFALAWMGISELYYMGGGIYEDHSKTDGDDKDKDKPEPYKRPAIKRPSFKKPSIGRPKIRR
ncbi:MAG: hypothetical protein ACTSWQ_09200 [Candidatus Thorarchaeota archaeon]